MFDLFYEQHRIIGPNTANKTEWARIDCPVQLIPTICELFADKGLIFKPKGKRQSSNNSNNNTIHTIYEMECGFNDLTKIAPLSYLYYREGDYRYHPNNCLIKYNKGWINRRLRMKFSTVRIDNDRNVVSTN